MATFYSECSSDSPGGTADIQNMLNIADLETTPEAQIDHRIDMETERHYTEEELTKLAERDSIIFVKEALRITNKQIRMFARTHPRIPQRYPA
ncbi:MAG TPA: hypothetical protein VK983_04280 [Candidatus Limnocylindrales bacterium]|nr:hypothetical protein [Candidatus Limnocylindrales bacterium]